MRRGFTYGAGIAAVLLLTAAIRFIHPAKIPPETEKSPASIPQKKAFAQFQRLVSESNAPAESSEARRLAEASSFPVNLRQGGREVAMANKLHGLQGTLDQLGKLTVRPADIPGRTGVSGWKWSLKLQALGRDGNSATPSAGSLQVRGNRTELQRADLSEWHINDADGFEHGLTLLHPPAGPAGQPFQLDFDLETSLAPRLISSAEGQAILFADAGGADVLRYSHLKVKDARGRLVPAQLSLSGRDSGRKSTLRMVVADAGFQYPLVVDPTIASANVAGFLGSQDGLPTSSLPSNMIALGSTLFFTASDAYGEELWKSDGTLEGTVLVKDLAAGGESPSFINFMAGQSILYFSCYGDNGVELWKTDGTASGTVRLFDHFPVLFSGAPNPDFQGCVGDTLFFNASDASEERKLWKSDGTAAGTQVLADCFLIRGLAVGSRMFFIGSTAAQGAELWVSDGTAAGTLLLADLKAGATTSNLGNFAALESKLIFTVLNGDDGAGLWQSDGTPAGTARITALPGATAMMSNTDSYTVGSRVIFPYNDGTNGWEYWVTDGTAAGTLLLADSVPGNNTFFPTPRAVSTTRLYFSVTDGSTQNLWTSDGTSAGTNLVVSGTYPIFDSIIMDSNLYYTRNVAGLYELWTTGPTAGSALKLAELTPDNHINPDPLLTVLNGKVLFRGYSDADGREPWSTDGTVAGTAIIKDISAGASWSVSRDNTGFVKAGSYLYMAADGDGGNELWRSDGTSGGTVLVRDIVPGGGAIAADNIRQIGSSIYFPAQTDSAGMELWKSDGTPAGTVMVKDIYPGPISSSPKNFAVMGSTLYFQARSPSAGTELWKSNGTESGTVLVSDIVPGLSGSSPSSLTVSGSQVYFFADTSSGAELWKSNGTAAGTVLVKDIKAGSGSSVTIFGPVPTPIFAAGGLVFFAADNGINGVKLWVSNGTSAGTVMPSDGGAGTALPQGFALVTLSGAPTVLFSASTVPQGRELWKYVFSTQTISLVKDSYPGFPSSLSTSSSFTVMNNVAYYAGQDANGIELWRSDGTSAGTYLVKNISAPASSNPLLLTAAGSTLFFRATVSGSGSGTELWKSDGTAAGTVLVRDIFPGKGSSYPTSLTAVGSAIYFSALGADTGRELWYSDGTAFGTRPVEDLQEGMFSSSPQSLRNVNGQLIYFVNDPATGGTGLRSLFSYILTVAAEPAGSGTVSGGGAYLAGSSATLQASALPGFRFASWAGDGLSSPASRTTIAAVDDNKTIQALFAPATYATWSETYFPGETDPLVIGATADPDGDGAYNLLEYATGTVPTNPQSFLNLSPQPATGGLVPLNGMLQLRSDDPALSFILQTSGDLVSWSSTDITFNGSTWVSSTGDWTISSVVSNGPELWQMRVQSTLPLGANSRQFYRLKVVRN